MDISSSPPAPGSTTPGDLYVDLQTRTLWLGVDAAVDPAESVLISDIVGILEEIDDALIEAKAYTDTQVALRAPLVHTHTAAQITNFNAAVTSVVAGIPGFNWVPGMILMWSGSLAEIGVGNLAGWVLCDGSSGSPDLRDRFIIGAGNKPVGNKNTAVNFNTSDDGAHIHVNQGTALTIAQLAPHTHPVSGSCSGNTGLESATHTHSQYTATAMVVEGGNGGTGMASAFGGFGTQTGGQSANHFHAFSGSVSGTAASVGSGSTHTHAMESGGTHHHAITPAQIRETVPYYALAFIYKL